MLNLAMSERRRDRETVSRDKESIGSGAWPGLLSVSVSLLTPGPSPLQPPRHRLETKAPGDRSCAPCSLLRPESYTTALHMC